MKPLCTTVIGSYPFPGWLEVASQHLDQFGTDDLAELIEDATRIAIEDQVDAGIDIVGPLPADAKEISVFTAGVHVRAQDPEADMQLARFVAAPAAHAVLRKTGLEPV